MKKELQNFGLNLLRPLMKEKRLFIMIAFSIMSFYSVQGQTVVTSLTELIEAVKLSDQTIVMEAGDYSMDDLSNSSARNIFCSGSNNTIDLTGVHINVTVGSVTTTYFTVAGDNNTVIGGEFEDTYNNGLTEVMDFSAYNQDKVNLAKGLRGAADMDVTGSDNLIDGVKLTVRGSYPYGYGSMYGISQVNIFGLDKRCGLLITGPRNTIDNVEIQQRAFGHGLFMQDNADETVIKNTLVEGRVRPTGDLYEENESYDLPFRSDFVMPYEDNRPIPTDEVHSLSEDGFRQYSGVGSVTIENCTAKKMRGGFRLYLGGAASVTNSIATDCGNTNFNMPGNGTVTNSSGNFAYAPLSDFRLGASNKNLEWTVIPSPDVTGPHNLADVLGNNQTVVFHRTPGPLDSNVRPIVVSGNNSTITNETEYPVILESSTNGNTIVSFGPVIDYGTGNTIEQVEASYDASIIIEAEDYSAMLGVETTTTTDDEGGNKISFIDTNDWVEYEVTVPVAGTYSFDYRVSGLMSGDFKVEYNSEIIDAVTFDATGGDETWETIRSETPVYFTGGIKTIRVTSNVEGWSLNWIQLLAECYDTKITSHIETANVLGIVLSDEETAKVTTFPGVTVSLDLDEQVGGSWSWSGPNDFSSDVREVILPDIQIGDSGDYVATFTNICGQKTEEVFVVNVTESLISEAEDFTQMSGVLTETTTDTGGGDNVKEINNEDWIEFEVYVPSTASFYIDYRVASAITGGSFTVSSEGRGIDTVSFDVTGGEQIWKTVTSSSLVALNIGMQTIRVSSTMDEWSLNWFELKLGQMVGACELPFNQDDIIISDETFSWSSGVMAITCEESVSVFANISGIGTLDDSDYLKIYYKLDDDELVLVSEKTGVFDDEFVYLEGLNGQVIEIVVEGYTSDANKTYVVSDLLVQYGSVILSDRIEAEDYDEIITGTGIKAEDSSDEGGGSQMGFLVNGDWLMFRNIDLTNAKNVTARVSSSTESGIIEVRLGNVAGTLIGSIPIQTTSSWTRYASYSTDLINTKGVHDVYFILPVGFNINWFQFSVDRTAMRDDEVRVVAEIEKVLGDDDYDPSAYVVSGLPVTYTSSNLEVAVIIDGKVSIVGVGTTTITATSEGSDLYYQAETTQTLTVTEIVLSIETIEDKVKVYPNPMGNYLMISMEGNQYRQLEIFDVTGTRVLNRSINEDEGSLHLDSEGLSKGMYMMVLSGAQKVESHKIIKL